MKFWVNGNWVLVRKISVKYSLKLSISLSALMFVDDEVTGKSVGRCEGSWILW